MTVSIDIRITDVTPIVTEIKFAEPLDKNGAGSAFKVIREGGNLDQPCIVDGVNDYVVIPTLKDANNLIIALERAKKEGFWK